MLRFEVFHPKTRFLFFPSRVRLRSSVTLVCLFSFCCSTWAAKRLNCGTPGSFFPAAFTALPCKVGGAPFGRGGNPSLGGPMWGERTGFGGNWTQTGSDLDGLSVELPALGRG